MHGVNSSSLFECTRLTVERDPTSASKKMLRVCAHRSTTLNRLLPRCQRLVCSSKPHTIWAPLIGYCAGSIWQQSIAPMNTQCSSAAALPATEPALQLVKYDVDKESVWKKVRRGLRMLRRFLTLVGIFSPILLLYPIASLLMENQDGQEPRDAREIVMSTLDSYDELPKGFLGLYYRMCLFSVEWSGAACIKFCQWAGSRPDIFGREFCLLFSRLQDNTTPHAWEHTEDALRIAYGDKWQRKIRLNEIIGSGCIAQVYKGAVLDTRGKEQEVAVKGKITARPIGDRLIGRIAYSQE